MLGYKRLNFIMVAQELFILHLSRYLLIYFIEINFIFGDCNKLKIIAKKI